MTTRDEGGERKKGALRSFEWVSAWLSGIIPSGAPPPTPRRSPPRGSRERRALTPLLSPNHRLFALNHLVNLLSRHMLGLTACAIPRQLDDSIPRENCPHESAKGQKGPAPLPLCIYKGKAKNEPFWEKPRSPGRGTRDLIRSGGRCRS